MVIVGYYYVKVLFYKVMFNNGFVMRFDNLGNKGFFLFVFVGVVYLCFYDVIM